MASGDLTLETDLTGQLHERGPLVQCGVLQHALEQLLEHATHFGTWSNVELPHHVLAVYGQVLDAEGLRTLANPLDPLLELVQVGPAGKPGSVCQIIGIPERE